MIITDLNKMSIEDLEIFSRTLGVTYLINDGVIVGTEKELANDKEQK